MELFNVSNGPDLTFVQTSTCQVLILEQCQFFKKSRHDFRNEPYSMNLKNKLKHVRQKVFNKHVRIMIHCCGIWLVEAKKPNASRQRQAQPQHIRIMIHYRGIWLVEARSQMFLGKGEPNRIAYTLTKGSYE